VGDGIPDPFRARTLDVWFARKDQRLRVSRRLRGCNGYGWCFALGGEYVEPGEKIEPPDRDNAGDGSVNRSRSRPGISLLGIFWAMAVVPTPIIAITIATRNRVIFMNASSIMRKISESKLRPDSTVLHGST
jgi:hypothetical protein